MNTVYCKYMKPMYWHPVKDPDLDLVVFRDAAGAQEWFRKVGFTKPKEIENVTDELSFNGIVYKLIWI